MTTAEATPKISTVVIESVEIALRAAADEAGVKEWHWYHASDQTIVLSDAEIAELKAGAETERGEASR